jgi:hypothetical protein
MKTIDLTASWGRRNGRSWSECAYRAATDVNRLKP